jgi:hypothetical protein
MKPNESVSFYVEFRDSKRRERMLAAIGEEETNRAGLVLLATEPEP